MRGRQASQYKREIAKLRTALSGSLRAAEESLDGWAGTQLLSERVLQEMADSVHGALASLRATEAYIRAVSEYIQGQMAEARRQP